MRFPAATEQTLRVQTREDGARIDQIILSPTTYFDSPPGTPINDTKIVPKSGGTTTRRASRPLRAHRAVRGAAAANAKPTTSITSPVNGAVFSAPATIQITAAAADADGTVTRLDFNAGNQFLYIAIIESLDVHVAERSGRDVCTEDDCGRQRPAASPTPHRSALPSATAPISLRLPSSPALQTARRSPPPPISRSTRRHRTTTAALRGSTSLPAHSWLERRPRLPIPLRGATRRREPTR